ncbi:MAG: signal peptide peptidase SppA [Clostridiales Family XIII bacterium]|jgi:protease-4|nr:signal peptide peptidase SppA [Clostridiales Family XIII bacterium]
MKAWQIGIIVFAVILVACMTLGVIFSRHSQPGAFSALTPYIARLNVEGSIAAAPSFDISGNAGYYHGWTLEKIDGLINDSSNKGILFFIDSPGGGVYESDELYLKIKEYKKTTGRPVYVSMGSMAASGGYYIASAADKIYANRNTWTGSIGVTMGTFIDISEFLSEHGVKTRTMISGRNKAMGGYFEPMTEEQQQIFQDLADEAYEQFTGIVAEERGFSDAKIKEIADGRIYTAKQALKLDLIDAIGTYDEAVEDMKETFGLENCPVIEEYYYKGSLLSRVLGSGLTDGIAVLLRYGKGDIGTVLELADKAGEMPVKYMYGR